MLQEVPQDESQPLLLTVSRILFLTDWEREGEEECIREELIRHQVLLSKVLLAKK
jgi:hypothetical protein